MLKHVEKPAPSTSAPIEELIADTSIDLDRDGPKAEARLASALGRLERAKRASARAIQACPTHWPTFDDAQKRQRRAEQDVREALARLEYLIALRRRIGGPFAATLRDERCTTALPIIPTGWVVIASR